MEIFCTRPNCLKPHNIFSDLDTEAKIRMVSQRFCTTCGMPLLLADRYLPEKLLGQGGFGAAFLACDRYKPKLPKCVVKQFKPSSDLDADEVKVAQDLFEREADVLEELGKENAQIPMLYAFFTPIVSNVQKTGTEQYFYLAQEFIDGQDLEQELEAKGRFSEAEVAEVLSEISKVLQFVHDRQTIHRDIKPSNIMRDRQGKLYLLDFGAVKQIAAGKGNSKKSTGIYSMGFAPPEQMSGAEIYPSTDLYALAVTCVHLLTGKPPEELYNSFDNLWQWHQFAPNISDRLKETFDKMLLSTPSQRFQSATEVLEALTTPTNKIPNTPAKFNSPPQPQPTLITKPHKQNQPIISTAPPTPNTPAALKNQNIPIVPAVPNPKLATPTPKKRQKRRFSPIETIYSAGFAGFEGALLSVGIINWLALSPESIVLIIVIMGGIVFALYRRAIEKLNLLLIASITAGVVTFIPKFHGALNAPTVIIIATVSASAAIAIVSFFRLVYQLLSRWL